MPKKNKTKYIDAYVLVVPKKKVNEYKKLARDACKIWIKHGALSYKESMGEDLNPDIGGDTMLPFKKLVKLKPSETVWFSYVEYKNKRHRNQVNAKVMKEMEGSDDCPDKMPFDIKRMSFGGFSVEVTNESL